ncbi:HNH endonuclease [Mycolicibacterium conceptionense]
MNPRQLAARDGLDCKICGDPVDMNANKDDLFRPSVDHIIPRSSGGSDDPSNLQLAHLWCNQVKNHRANFTLVLESAARGEGGRSSG